MHSADFTNSGLSVKGDHGCHWLKAEVRIGSGSARIWIEISERSYTNPDLVLNNQIENIQPGLPSDMQYMQ